MHINYEICKNVNFYITAGDLLDNYRLNEFIYLHKAEALQIYIHTSSKDFATMLIVTKTKLVCTNY